MGCVSGWTVWPLFLSLGSVLRVGVCSFTAPLPSGRPAVVVVEGPTARGEFSWNKRRNRETTVLSTSNNEGDETIIDLPSNTDSTNGMPPSMSLPETAAGTLGGPYIIPTSSSSSKLPSSSSTSKPLVQLSPTVWSCRSYLWSMCRPSNFPGVFLFHTLGVWLALASPPTGLVSETSAPTALLARTLIHPQMLVVLLSLLLTSSTSMVVNDYYDNRSGVDASKLHKPLVSGHVSLNVVKRFLYYMYATVLLCVSVLPGVPARLSVLIGVMLTYNYTQHLKPLTWWKNVVCATLIALSPVTSGASAYHLNNSLLSSSSCSVSSWQVFSIPALVRVVGTLFLGFCGREVLMDINDTQDDRLYGVQTVPVRYGRKYASKVAWWCSVSTALIAVGGPLRAVLLQQRPMATVVRRLVLATMGSAAMLYRAWQVYQVDGEDKDKVERAVEEGKLTVLFVLASFV